MALDKGFVSLLKSKGVRLSAEAPATLSGRVVRFPVSGGKVDPTTGQGTVEHEGALVLRAGSRRIPIRFLQLKTTRRHAPFAAKVGGGQLKLASATKVAFSRHGFAGKVKVSGLRMSQQVATRLEKKLRLRGAIPEAQPIGSAVTVADPAAIFLQGRGAVALSLDPAIVDKLKSLFVAINPIFPAEHVGAPFSFPLLGGTIAPDAGSGTVEADGSLELLQLGGGQVFIRLPRLEMNTSLATAELDVEPSPPYAGKVDRTPFATISLSGAGRSANAAARTVGVENGILALTTTTADAFNQAFAEGKPTFGTGEVLGTIGFTAFGQ
ncbi:MAG: hypothetical protein ACTHNY_01170 [Solirubrobacterales bacterium]